MPLPEKWMPTNTEIAAMLAMGNSGVWVYWEYQVGTRRVKVWNRDKYKAPLKYGNLYSETVVMFS